MVTRIRRPFLRNVRLPLKPDGAEDWQHKASLQKRKHKRLPYIGLRNPGARCYINSMLQQLQNTQEFRECISAASEAPAPEEAEAEDSAATWGCDVCTMRNTWEVLDSSSSSLRPHTLVA